MIRTFVVERDQWHDERPMYAPQPFKATISIECADDWDINPWELLAIVGSAMRGVCARVSSIREVPPS